jgi:lysophospholipase L1-like esterase
MRKKSIVALLLSFSIWCSTAQTRVACIGNSITFGAGVENRELNCYPAQLQYMLGSKFEVRNFGSNGRTMLRKGDYPYWNDPAYKEAQNYLPNIVIIKLGTNDSKPQNWKYKSEFEKDYRDFIHSFSALSSHPKIYLCRPIPAFTSGNFGITDAVISGEVIPIIEKIAKDENLELIDLYTPFVGKGNLVPDAIHPNAEGAKLLAGEVFNAITKSNSEKFKGAKSSWNGFDKYEFYFNGRLARLICPKNPRQGNPWIWNARFPDWHSEMDRILLEKGFFVTYLNTDELLGSPECVEIWKEFYSYLIKTYDLNKKVALEGVSRGGLYVYNFASKYPEVVSCIYGEGPVCDFKSWPGGFGKSIGSKEDWELLKRVYNFKNDSVARAYKYNPIDNLQKIAQAKIPIIHFVSKTDSVVPSDENTYILEERYKKLGGKITLVFCSKHDPGSHGHHYKIETPEKGANFIMSNSFEKVKIDAKAYHKYNGNFNNSRIKFEKEKVGRVAFLGGSITYNGGWRDSICNYLKQRFPQTKFEFINAGIPSTGSVPGAFRFANDVWSKGKIDLLFEEAAVNDGSDGNDMTSTLMIRGMEGIIRHARTVNPAMDIVMMHFVDPGKIKMYNEGKTPEVIQQFEKVADFYGISTINLAKEVTDRINNHEFSWEKDFVDLHPSPFGQGIYSNSMIEFFDDVWKKELPTNSKIKNHKIPKKKLDVFSYSKGKYVNIEDAKLIKGWKYIKKWKPTDVGGRKGFEDVPVLEATIAGAELQITFTGTAAGVFVAAGTDAGILETSIDGGPFTKTDLFTKWSSSLHLPWVYVLHDDLIKGKHTMVVRMSNERNSASKGNACRIVYFVVN